MINIKTICGLLLALVTSAVVVHADTLELRNGSLIKGKFLSATETSISFQVGPRCRVTMSQISDQCGSKETSKLSRPRLQGQV